MIDFIASYAGKTVSPLDTYLPLRNVEGVTVHLAKDGPLKLRAHTVLVTGYLDSHT